MTLKEGGRVRLAVDLRLTDWVAMTADPTTAPEPAPASASSPSTEAVVVGSLSLAAGTEGVVVSVLRHDEPSQEAREYERLTSLRDSFGHQMPEQSKRQLDEKIEALEPEWTAYLEQRLRVTVRVRFDNGFILDDAHEDLFTPA